MFIIHIQFIIHLSSFFFSSCYSVSSRVTTTVYLHLHSVQRINSRGYLGFPRSNDLRFTPDLQWFTPGISLQISLVQGDLMVIHHISLRFTPLYGWSVIRLLMFGDLWLLHHVSLRFSPLYGCRAIRLFHARFG